MEGTTFEELYAMAINHLELYLEGGTIVNYNYAMKSFSKLNKKVIANITSLDVQECVDALIKKGLKSITVINT
ncbi:MAG TPA: hypothetical protein DC038_04490 [Clostridiales bacterium]|nr:hypothetical protein [Clostridiales bacterium]